jgi:hypothetical protein
MLLTFSLVPVLATGTEMAMTLEAGALGGRCTWFRFSGTRCGGTLADGTFCRECSLTGAVD